MTNRPLKIQTGRSQKAEGYALFDIDASKQEIESYLQGRSNSTSEDCAHDFPRPHELGLELKLEEVDEFTRGQDIDPELSRTIDREITYSTYPEAYRYLMKSARPTPLKNLKYVIRARNDNTNEDVCEKLTTVMNDVYLRFGKKEPFTVMILGKAPDNQYHPWDNEIKNFYDPQEMRKAA